MSYTMLCSITHYSVSSVHQPRVYISAAFALPQYVHYPQFGVFVYQRVSILPRNVHCHSSCIATVVALTQMLHYRSSLPQRVYYHSPYITIVGVLPQYVHKCGRCITAVRALPYRQVHFNMSVAKFIFCTSSIFIDKKNISFTQSLRTKGRIVRKNVKVTTQNYVFGQAALNIEIHSSKLQSRF